MTSCENGRSFAPAGHQALSAAGLPASYLACISTCWRSRRRCHDRLVALRQLVPLVRC